MNIENIKNIETKREPYNIDHNKIIKQMIGKYSATYPINSVDLKAIFK